MLDGNTFLYDFLKFRTLTERAYMQVVACISIFRFLLLLNLGFMSCEWLIPSSDQIYITSQISVAYRGFENPSTSRQYVITLPEIRLRATD